MDSESCPRGAGAQREGIGGRTSHAQPQRKRARPGAARTAVLAVFLWVLIAPSAAVAQEAPGSWEEPSTYTIGDATYRVEKRSVSVENGSERWFGSTVTAVRITDGDGAAIYEQSFDLPTEGEEGFHSAHRVRARAIRSEGETIGLLLAHRIVPSAPTAGSAVRLFTSVRGELEPVSEWLPGVHSIGPKSSEETISTGEARTIHLRFWRDYFEVTVPVRLDPSARAPIRAATFAPEARSSTHPVAYLPVSLEAASLRMQPGERLWLFEYRSSVNAANVDELLLYRQGRSGIARTARMPLEQGMEISPVGFLLDYGDVPPPALSAIIGRLLDQRILLVVEINGERHVLPSEEFRKLGIYAAG